MYGVYYSLFFWEGDFVLSMYCISLKDTNF